MRIAQVAPLFESVPPKLYGGTERVVSWLTEELVRQGHEVTLFASGDSQTAARLVSVWDRALRLDPREPDAVSLHVLMVEAVFGRAADFDVIHFHIDAMQLPLVRRYLTPCLGTMHGRLDIAGLDLLYAEFAEMPLVSVSEAQRVPLPRANWLATVLHGLPADLYAPGAGAGGYVAFLGRISPEKGVDRAIEIAKASGIPLKIAAKVDNQDRDYFESCIRGRIDGRAVEYLGELGDADKARFLQDAAALLFPIDWPEPFGLAMIEAMACGTPVLAFRRGSVSEVMAEGVTGFVVDSVADAVHRIPAVVQLDRAGCRLWFEERFTAARMARDYCAAYRMLLEGGRARG